MKLAREPYEKHGEQKSPEHLFRIVLIALHTALRKDNILTLTWDDVDLEAGTISIDGSKMKAGRPHNVPLHPELWRFMQQWRKGAQPSDPVIGAKARTFQTAWTTLIDRAGLTATDEWTERSFHCLRTTANTWFKKLHGDIWARALLAHSSGDVQDRYTDIVYEDLRPKVDAMPWLVLPAPEPASV